MQRRMRPNEGEGEEPPGVLEEGLRRCLGIKDEGEGGGREESGKTLER